jgi:hypothetical protein
MEGCGVYELIRCYEEAAPAARFIGKKYHNEDRGPDGGFGGQWTAYMEKGWNKLLEKAAPGADALFPDGLSHIGLMCWSKDAEKEPFEYWVGIFAPPETKVPEGFESVDFASATLGVAWIRGDEQDLYGHEGECAGLCMKNGMRIASVGGSERAWYFFERYANGRFGEKDAEGKTILDICHFIVK